MTENEMDWNQAIKECPSNVDGKCRISPNNKACSDNVSSGKCPIKQLQKLEVTSDSPDCSARS